MRVRILLHALDRTGPPMLALAFARWMARHQPEHEVEWVSFRGGPLLHDVVQVGAATVLLDPRAPWDHRRPDARELDIVRSRAATVAPADVMLAVSVAAGQVLPYLPEPSPPLVTWSVERGEDLHWLDGSLPLRERTALWLAGSDGIRSELREHLGDGAEVSVAPEFVELPPSFSSEQLRRRRQALGCPDPPGLLVLGAGIATFRKSPDLFLELALASVRRHGPVDRFVWLGGEDDPLFTALLQEIRRLGLDNLRLMGNVTDVVPWLAASDVLAHPARLDAFPLVALHSALAGTPVIGFRESGGLKEMFGDQLLGATYPDVPELLDCLDRLRDETFRARIGERQRAQVAHRFSAESAAATVFGHLCDAALGTERSPR